MPVYGETARRRRGGSVSIMPPPRFVPRKRGARALDVGARRAARDPEHGVRRRARAPVAPRRRAGRPEDVCRARRPSRARGAPTSPATTASSAGGCRRRPRHASIERQIGRRTRRARRAGAAGTRSSRTRRERRAARSRRRARRTAAGRPSGGRARARAGSTRRRRETSAGAGATTARSTSCVVPGEPSDLADAGRVKEPRDLLRRRALPDHPDPRGAEPIGSRRRSEAVRRGDAPPRPPRPEAPAGRRRAGRAPRAGRAAWPTARPPARRSSRRSARACASRRAAEGAREAGRVRRRPRGRRPTGRARAGAGRRPRRGGTTAQAGAEAASADSVGPATATATAAAATHRQHRERPGGPALNRDREVEELACQIVEHLHLRCRYGQHTVECVTCLSQLCAGFHDAPILP